MGPKNPKGSVTIENNKSRLRLRWRYQAKWYSINLSVYNKMNFLKARKTALLLEQDMMTENFDFYLVRYTTKNDVHTVRRKTTVQYFEEYTTSYMQMDCEKHTNYNSVRNMIKKWGKVEQDNIFNKLNE